MMLFDLMLQLHILHMPSNVSPCDIFFLQKIEVFCVSLSILSQSLGPVNEQIKIKLIHFRGSIMMLLLGSFIQGLKPAIFEGIS